MCHFSSDHLTPHPTHESLLAKNTAFRDFSNIWRGCILFLLTFARVACNIGAADVWKVVRNWRVLYIFYFKMYVSPQRRAFFQYLNFKKCSRTLRFFNIFTSKCVFHHSGVHFSNILNFKKCSRTLSFFLTFSLPNVFFTTAACIFSTSELQKVLPDLQFFNIFTSKCVFHHSGVHFFNIWTSKSAPGPSVF